MTTDRLIAMLALVIFVGACIGSFFLGRASVTPEPIGVQIERDTIIVRDTIRESYPEYITQTIVRTERVEIPIKDTIIVRDTIEVEIPITERTYLDEEYKAIVQGYNPILKSIEVYPKTAYITTTETIKERKRWGVSIGIQGGYGITPKGYQPYAGVGVSFGYNF